MSKQKSPDCTQCCSHCEKNSELVRHYEHLFHLIKKKELKDSQDISSRTSQKPNASNSSGLSVPETAAHRLAQILQSIVFKRCFTFFLLATQKSAKKFALLALTNRWTKNAQKMAFEKMCKISSSNKETLCQMLVRKQEERKRQALLSIKAKTQFSVVQAEIHDTLVDKQGAYKKVVEGLSQLKGRVFELTSDKLLRRKNMELEISNNKLVLQNKLLRQCLDESNRRQAKENQKKKDSLQMLADQLNEKNDLIIELQSTLRAYEQKYEMDGNVLEDDVVSLKKELQHLESIRDRFDHQLAKSRDKLELANSEIKLLNQKIEQLSSENEEMKKNSFHLNAQSIKVQRTDAQLQQLTKAFEKKMMKLKIYEKQLQGKEEKPTTLNSDSFVDELKTEMVLCFLTNISIPDYSLHGQHLFDPQELDLLRQHKQLYIRNEKEANQIIQSTPIRGQKQHQLEMRGIPSESLFDILQNSRQEEEASLPERRPGPTMKLMELQLEKNKTLNKMGELKQKLMHIRVIVLNLLKSMELQPPLKQQTEGILSVISDIFEYSQEERESMFVKKKKLFGFI